MVDKLDKKNAKLIYVSSLLVYLIPLTLLTGPFLPDLFLCLVAIAFLYISISEKNFKYFKNRYFYFLIIFYFYLLISSLMSTDIVDSLKSCFFYFRFIIFSLAVWHLIESNKNFIKTFTISLLIVFLFAIVEGSFQYMNGTNLIGYVPAAANRLMLPLDDKLILGGFLSRLFPLLIALLIFKLKNSKLYLFFYALIFISIDVLTYLSGERTALFLLLLSSVLIVTLLTNFKLFRIICIILSLSIIAILSLLNPDIRKRNIDYTINQFQEKITSTNSEDKINIPNQRILFFSVQHDIHFRTAYRIFIDNPLTGAGPGQFENLCSKDIYHIEYVNHEGKISSSCSTHPHNTYIQIIAETGVIGLLFILLLGFYLCFKLLNHIYNNFFNKREIFNDFQVCLVVCFILTLWPLIPSQNFFNNWINIIYYLPVGFYLHSIYSKNSLRN